MLKTGVTAPIHAVKQAMMCACCIGKQFRRKGCVRARFQFFVVTIQQQAHSCKGVIDGSGSSILFKHGFAQIRLKFRRCLSGIMHQPCKVSCMGQGGFFQRSLGVLGGTAVVFGQCLVMCSGIILTNMGEANFLHGAPSFKYEND